MATDTQANKRAYVAQILTNGTYLPESGVYKRLEQVLLKLAKDDLATLNMLIDLRIKEGIRNE